MHSSFQDQQDALQKHFFGMTEASFGYSDYEQTRERLVGGIHASLTENDRRFLLSFEETNPDWSIYDFQRFPSVQWKLQNLQKLRSVNPAKHLQQLEALKKKLK
jgi:hypothetical protein